MARSSGSSGASVPHVPGLLDAAQVAQTAASIAAMQEPSGAVPWTVGEHVDIWNHVEAAMALLLGGEVEAAERAYDWAMSMQRPDGSWPMKIVAGEVEDDRGEVNMSAYLAVGVWHHWLVRGDRAFVERCWPSVRAGLDWVVSLQRPEGSISWTEVDDLALLSGCSSIHQSLRAGVALADLLDDPQPGWELAGGRLVHALRRHRDRFADKSTYSMDWYYPVLGGAVRGPEAHDLLATRWDDFVVPGLGIRCVDTNPWVTGAETCELAMALDAVGDHDRARRLVADMQHLRADDGSYFTGWVYADHTNVGEVTDVYWPVENTTYTAAAVLLAVDALAATQGTPGPGSGIMRGDTLAPPFEEIALDCGCASADRVARRA